MIWRVGENSLDVADLSNSAMEPKRGIAEILVIGLFLMFASSEAGPAFAASSAVGSLPLGSFLTQVCRR